jgi:HEXXH motif-containing protein
MAPSSGLTIATAHFDQLASGFGDSSAVEELAQAQASVNRALLASAGQALANQTTEAAWAWELLQVLDEKHPAAVANAIAHSFFRAWAFQAIDDPVSAHPATLVGYALAASSHAKLAAELPVPLDTTTVYLPGIGRIATVAGKAVLGDGGEPLRYVAKSRYLGGGGEGGPRVLLEDLDDQRDAFQLPPTDQLSDDEFAQWDAAYNSAWQLLKDQYGEYVGGLETGLRVIMPLKPSPDGHAASGTARQAFGALGLALPPEPDILALLLIHEFQHVKMGAVLDLFDLYDESDTRLYYAPWREDPRPLEGLIQGVYAHAAVIDFWRRRTERGDAKAAIHFARWRAQTWEALENLEASGSLTETRRSIRVEAEEDHGALARDSRRRRGARRGIPRERRASLRLRFRSGERALMEGTTDSSTTTVVTIDRDQLRAQLIESGLRKGTAVLVHCSMRRIGRVQGGADALRDTLLEILDEKHGTLVVPAQTRSKSSTSTAFLNAIAGLDDEGRELYLKVMPGFDPRTSPSEGMGALAESVRTHPRAYRSTHPATSFAAVGRHAEEVCATHPLDCLLGARSPLGALRKLDARVLLLGVGFDKCTSFHLGEEAVFRLERPYLCKIGDEWRDFKGFPHRDDDFTELGARFEHAYPGEVREGEVGTAPTRLFPLAMAADFAAWQLPKLRFAR